MTTARCDYCRQPIVGAPIVSGWGDRFCARHLDEWPRCAFCWGVAFGDDPIARHRVAAHARCRRCAAAAIDDPTLARGIVNDMIDWLQGEGLTLEQTVKFSCRLVDRPDLQEAKGDRADALGKAYVTQMGDAPIRIQLHLLKGMPSPLFEGVTVHELGHAWLACRHVTALPPWANEGFCELISHRWYRFRGTRDAAWHAERIERRTDPVYGGGFRRLRALEQRVGFSGIVGALISTRTLPA